MLTLGLQDDAITNSGNFAFQDAVPAHRVAEAAIAIRAFGIDGVSFADLHDTIGVPYRSDFANSPRNRRIGRPLVQTRSGKADEVHR